MIEIIPAIDIIEGRCVRLTGGDFNAQTIYRTDPADVARQFADIGLRRLHVVDLDGARTGRIRNLHVLEKITRVTDLIVDFGGGIKTCGDAASVFGAGAKMLSVGSLAVHSPETLIEWLQEFGGEKIILGADARGGKISVGGWQETTELDLLEFLQYWFERGITQAFCTDIERDGRMAGAAIDLYRKIYHRLSKLNLIASGGVTSLNDISEVEAAGCRGVIIGKAIYENRITQSEIKKFLTKNAG